MAGNSLKRALGVLGLFLLTIAAVGCSADARKSRALARANDYFASGERDKAKIEYLSVLKTDPSNAVAVERLGAIWYEQGAPLRAAPFYLRTRDLDPNNLTARARLGLILASAGKFPEARKEAVTILEKSPDHDDALMLLAEASRNPEDIQDTERRLRSVNATNKVGFHLALAALNLRKKDIAAAERAVKDALSINPSSAEAHVALGKIYWVKNELNKADGEFKTAAQLAPPRSPERFLYAEFQTRTGRLAEARLLLQELTADTPDFLPAWRLLAQVALAEKKFDEALALADNCHSAGSGEHRGPLAPGADSACKRRSLKSHRKPGGFGHEFSQHSSDKAPTGARVFTGQKLFQAATSPESGDSHHA